MAIRAILFDKDGTLLDYDASWGYVNRQVALMAARGDPSLADRLLEACGMDPVSGQVFADSVLAAGNTIEIAQGLARAGSEVAVEELIEKINVLFLDAAEFGVPVTDLAALLSRLKRRGLKLGIASSDNERSIRRTVALFGLGDHVDFIAGYDSGHGSKPEPGMVLGFCAAIGIGPENVAVVGDNNHDLNMARNARAGLAIGVLTGTGNRQSLHLAADFILEDISAIEGLLDELLEEDLGEVEDWARIDDL